MILKPTKNLKAYKFEKHLRLFNFFLKLRVLANFRHRVGVEL